MNVVVNVQNSSARVIPLECNQRLAGVVRDAMIVLAACSQLQIRPHAVKRAPERIVIGHEYPGDEPSRNHQGLRHFIPQNASGCWQQIRYRSYLLGSSK